MTKKRRPTPDTTIEASLVGASIALTVTYWVVAATTRGYVATATAQQLDNDLALRFGIAEVVIVGFLCIFVIRRRAHGLALLLPFATFLITLLLCVIWVPMHRIARASRGPEVQTRVTQLRNGRIALDVTKLFTLFGIVFTLTPTKPKPKSKRR